MLSGLFKQSAAPAAPSLGYSAISLAGSCITIGLTAWLTQVSQASWLIAPFGASCVLAFGLPESPLAQPRSIIGGHVIATLVGLLMLALCGNSWWSEALAVGLALFAMQQTRTVHAPAGANPLVVMTLQPDWSFLLTPVLSGACMIVAVAWAINNLRSRGSYPRYWR